MFGTSEGTATSRSAARRINLGRYCTGGLSKPQNGALRGARRPFCRSHCESTVMALYSMMFMGMGPLGALVAGSIAERVGAPAVVAAGGIATLLAAIVFAIRLPALRGPARELIVAQQAALGEPA